MLWKFSSFFSSPLLSHSNAKHTKKNGKKSFKSDKISLYSNESRGGRKWSHIRTLFIARGKWEKNQCTQSLGKRFNYATIKRKLHRVITMQMCSKNYAELLRQFTGYSVVSIARIMGKFLEGWVEGAKRCCWQKLETNEIRPSLLMPPRGVEKLWQLGLTWLGQKLIWPQLRIPYIIYQQQRETCVISNTQICSSCLPQFDSIWLTTCNMATKTTKKEKKIKLPYT